MRRPVGLLHLAAIALLAGTALGDIPDDVPEYLRGQIANIAGYCYWHQDGLTTEEERFTQRIAAMLRVDWRSMPNYCQTSQTWRTYTESCLDRDGVLWDITVAAVFPGGLESFRYCVIRMVRDRHLIVYNADLLHRYPLGIGAGCVAFLVSIGLALMRRRRL